MFMTDLNLWGMEASTSLLGKVEACDILPALCVTPKFPFPRSHFVYLLSLCFMFLQVQHNEALIWVFRWQPTTIFKYKSLVLHCQILSWQYLARRLVWGEEEYGEYIWLEKVNHNVSFRYGTFHCLDICIWKFRSILIVSRQQVQMCSSICNCKIMLLRFFFLSFFFFSHFPHFHNTSYFSLHF